MFILMDGQGNKLMYLENSLVMYGIYNAETLEKLVKTVQVIHSRQSLIEGLFAGKSAAAYEAYYKCMDNAVFSIMQLILCYIYK